MSQEMLTTVDDAIRELEEQHFRDEVDYEDYVIQRIILSSQRMDVAPNARSRNMRTSLDVVLNSPQWDRAKSLGYYSHTSSPAKPLKGHERINRHIASLQDSTGILSIDSRFYNRMVTGNEKNDDIRFQIESLLTLFEQAGIDSTRQHEMSLISAIMLQGIAFSFIGQTVGTLTQGTPSAVEEGREEDFWNAKLLGVTDRKNSVAYSLGFSGRMEQVALHEASEVFGRDNAPGVVELLKAMWFTKLKDIPAGPKRDKALQAFQEIVSDISVHALGEAWEKMDTFCRNFPQSISTKTALRITGESPQQLIRNLAEKKVYDDKQKRDEQHRKRRERIKMHAQYILNAGSDVHKPVVESAIGRVISLPTATGLADFIIEAVYDSSVSVLNYEKGPSLQKSLSVTKVRLKRTVPHTTRSGVFVPEERIYKLAGEIVQYLL